MRTRACCAALLASLLLAAPALAGLQGARALKQSRANAPRSAPESGEQPQVPVNDTCAGAILLPCGNINIDGTTNGATNDYTFSSDFISCTTWIEDGRDIVYRVDANPGDSLWVDYRNVADGAIYLLTDCNDPDNSCVAGADATIAPNEVESLRYKFTSAGTYYLILDSYGNNTSGDFTLVGQLLCGSTSPPQNDICANAITIHCGDFSYSGSTQFAANDYGFPDAGSSCTGQLADGNDVVYKLNITAGDTLTIDYTTTTDGSMYIVANCNDEAGTCIAGVDATGPGQTESLVYNFSYSGTYYLVLDSRDAGSFGSWTATGRLGCINPPPVNDQCSGALPITCGAFNLSGSTKLATNDYFYITSANSCTGYYTDGNDVVYKMVVNTGDSLWVDFSSTSDGSVYLVTDCDSLVTSCLYGVDVGITGDPEYLRYVFLQPDTVYMIFDSVDLNSWGTWTAVGELLCGAVSVPSGSQIGALAFHSVLPNPFSNATSIAFTVPTSARTTLRIYDLQGRVARTLADQMMTPGEHRVTWNGTDDQGARLLPGVYFARLTSGGQTTVQRMIFIR